MNKLMLPLILLVLALNTSCHYSDRRAVDRLDSAARALSENSKPDSVRVLLDSINPELLNDFDKSRLAMLTAMARYKSYIPIGSDSLLQVAVKEFEGRGDSLEYISCLLAGVANSEVRNYNRAFMNLRRAENLALADSNFYYAALAQRQQGDIYKSVSLAKEEMEMACAASENFRKANKPEHEKWQIFAKADALKNMHRPAEALELLNAALNDTANMDEAFKRKCYYEMSVSYELINRPDLALKYFNLSGARNPDNVEQLLWLSRMYSYCKMIPEAEECLELAADKDLSHNDSINYLFVKSHICHLKGDYQGAFLNLVPSYNMYTYDLEKSANTPFDDFSDQYYKELSEKNLLIGRQHELLAFIMMLSAILLAIILIGLFIYLRRRNKERNNALKEDVERLTALFDSAKLKELEYRRNIAVSEYKTLEDIYGKWIMADVMGDARDKSVKIVKDLIYKLNSDEGFAELETFIDHNCDNLMRRIRALYPAMRQAQFRLIMLTYINFSTDTIAYILGKDKNKVYSAKNRLKRYILEKSPEGPELVKIIHF